MAEWKWADDGRSVKIGKQKYEVVASSLGDLEEYIELYDEAKWVFSRITAGDRAFMLGEADYEDATRKLQHIRLEIAKSKDLLSRRAHEISSFFNPADISQAFGDDVKSLALFIQEALIRLAEMPAGNLEK